MHPISKSEKEILFDGFSKDEKGRSKYLKMRKNFDPEEKYRYPQLSSWEYGWNFKHITTPGKTQCKIRVNLGCMKPLLQKIANFYRKQKKWKN